MKKARCSHCDAITENLPVSHVCKQCGMFSNDWYIYDWAAFVSFKRMHIVMNWVVFTMSLSCLAAIVFLGIDDFFLWLLSLLAFPAVYDLFKSYGALRDQDKYQGHRMRDTCSWIPLM